MTETYTHDADEFITRFALHTGPEITQRQLQVRINHLQEELQELQQAADRRDTAEILDALVDLAYIAVGTARMCDWDFAEAWRRVHTANMQKIRAERAVDSKRGTTFDVVKPTGWQAADLTDLVEVNDDR